ncbi:uncharacterized protein EI90DRAFT_3029791, partial [Cantharellus anzutake]|uniref:uncharacterized protein n=1 Tax=Cantharellus anzutake TaxID=1750568 RepID=UPI00190328F0
MSKRPTDTRYVKERGPFREFIFRRRIWFETTFVLSMLEPWEKLLVLIVIIFTTALLFTGICLYLPQHLQFLRSRASFYLSGD